MISASAKSYLGQTANVRQAHLVEVELAGATDVFEYWTDFRSDVPWQGKVYQAGKVINVGNVILTQGLTNYKVSVTVPGEYDEEAKKATSDDSYEGRRIRVYRAYLNDSNEIIPMQSEGPLVLFEGEITDIKLRDPIVSGSSEVTWECAGELQDFEKVTGRMTDDAQHRGLVTKLEDGKAILVPSDAAYREEYKTDTGFLHSGHTITAAIPYLTTEKEYYYKKAWHGLSGSLRTRDVEVERQIDLALALEAKYLPVVYGVQKVQGVPVFADVLKDDPTRGFIVYAVCEGEINSFLNVYVNGASAMCGPGADRQDSYVCVGNMGNGDTLSTYVRRSQAAYLASFWDKFPYNKGGEPGVVTPPWVDTPPWRDTEPGEIPPPPYFVGDPDRTNTEGTQHGERFTIGAPEGPITMTFYHGKPDQLPDEVLVNLAASKSFLLQNTRRKANGEVWGPEYWQGATAEKTGAALLDTAYVVAEFSLSEDRTEIPTLEFVVQGRDALTYVNGVKEYKQTLNPVWHTLDYITNDRFGPGIPESKVLKESWEYSANKLNEIDESYEPEYLVNWRYIGWTDLSPDNRTIMQCNTVIDTSSPVTKEVETLLGHFNGTIIPWRGFYHMSVETDDAPVANLSVKNDVIGRVSVESRNNRDKWNSISTSIRNPADNWGSTQVSFFNSDYLEEDKGIRKQGRAAFSYITNYYTARSWSEYLLANSRFGKIIRFTTYFKYFFIKPNDNVTLTHSRFGFVAPNNKFRVISVEDAPDGNLTLTLLRYDSAAFDRSPQPEEDGIPDEGEQLLPPQNFTFIQLPQPGIDVSTPSGINCGIIYWDPPTIPAKILRYEIDLGSDRPIQAVLPSNLINIGGEPKVFLVVESLTPNTTYRFRGTSIYNSGDRSAFAVIKPTTGEFMSPNSLDPVTNFKVVNQVEDTREFSGPDLILAWDEYEGAESFEVQIRTADQTVLTTQTVQQPEYTFTFSLNSTLFSSFTGKLGAYRQLSPRVRVRIGDTVSNWTNL